MEGEAAFLQGFLPSLLAGAALTIQLALCTVIAGCIGGFAVAMAKVSPWGWLRALANGYSNVFRALPDLLVILIAYFGLQQALSAALGSRVEIGPFLAGVIALSVIFAAYASEVFRAAYEAVPAGQLEAARAAGMGTMLTMRRVHFPLLIRLALPSLGNLWLVLLKDTSLVAVIGLQGLMRKAQMATSVTKDPFTFYLAAAILYILISIASSMLLTGTERHLGRSTVRRA